MSEYNYKRDCICEDFIIYWTAYNISLGWKFPIRWNSRRLPNDCQCPPKENNSNCWFSKCHQNNMCLSWSDKAFESCKVHKRRRIRVVRWIRKMSDFDARDHCLVSFKHDHHHSITLAQYYFNHFDKGPLTLIKNFF